MAAWFDRASQRTAALGYLWISRKLFNSAKVGDEVDRCTRSKGPALHFLTRR
jgi:hypothetical protein